MSFVFRNKIIVILSPQSWNHLFVSKHHYARALAKENKVFFVGPPRHNRSFSFYEEKDENFTTLSIITYTIPCPDSLRFRWPWLYKIFVKRYLKKVMHHFFNTADVSFDFGCYRQFDSQNFFPSQYKIFFPVDDTVLIKADTRGSNLVLSVSSNIVAKFPKGECYFINHGVSDDFIIQQSSNPDAVNSSNIRVCYSGNLFISFLDIDVLKNIIVGNPEIEFHFFGSLEFDEANQKQLGWFNFLNSRPNIFIHGVVSQVELASWYAEMSAFVLCYKPDYINYHGENSHKVLEYLSTGKVIISTYLSLYRDTPLMQMSPQNENEKLVSEFSHVMRNLSSFNSNEKMQARKEFALDNTYTKQVQRIATLLDKTSIEK